MWDVVGKAAGVASPEELMKFSIQEVINLIRAAPYETGGRLGIIFYSYKSRD